MSRYTDSEIFFVTDAVTGRWRASTTLHWEVGKKDSGWIIEIPPEFASDVSIPAILRPFINPGDSRFHKAARVHDYMLEHGYDRVEAAGAFYSALCADGVGKTLAVIMFISVFAHTVVWERPLKRTAETRVSEAP